MQTHERSTTRLLVLALLASALAAASHAWTTRSEAQRGLAPGPASAPPPEQPAVSPPVEVTFGGPRVVIEPRVSGVATTIYVSCSDGTYVHRELEGVGTALVDLVREDGSPVADGRCKLEVYVHPPVDHEAMRIADETGDIASLERLSRIEQEETVIWRGHFGIHGGLAVGPHREAP